jgi:hypothetical protein
LYFHVLTKRTCAGRSCSGQGTSSKIKGLAEEEVALREIAETTGSGIGFSSAASAADEAAVHFDGMARFVGIDNPACRAWSFG